MGGSRNNKIAIKQVELIAPAKLKKKAILNIVPLSREPSMVRRNAIKNAVLKSNRTKANKVTIFARPNLTPGIGKGMGIRASNRWRIMARDNKTAIIVCFLKDNRISSP
jgi:hypothetical protein